MADTVRGIMLPVISDADLIGSHMDAEKAGTLAECLASHCVSAS